MAAGPTLTPYGARRVVRHVTRERRAGQRRPIPWIALLLGVAMASAGGILAMRSAVPAEVGTVPAAVPSSTIPRETAEPMAVEKRPARRAQPRPAIARPVRLSLPRLDAQPRVTPVGLNPDGTLVVPDHPEVLGWWNSGAAPGSRRGSVVIDGHVDSAEYGVGIFARLGELRPGDPVVVENSDGRRVRYTVVARRYYPRDNLPAAVFARQVASRLVLITCGGRFDRDAGGYSHNVVVYAVPAP